MLTEERHQLILNFLKRDGIVKVNDLVQWTNTSESTIRRDLSLLEKKKALKRIHGGATFLKGIYTEPSYNEKLIQNSVEKSQIGKYAASRIEEGDCIYLDGGTTTFEMIKYIEKKDIVVVTNGLKHVEELIEKGVNAYILGGRVKGKTKVVAGGEALVSLKKFRFDKAFLGINGIHLEYGFTTPDSDEGILKESAIQLSKKAFVLADESKFGEISFIKIADLEEAIIITNTIVEQEEEYKQKTEIQVVTTE